MIRVSPSAFAGDRPVATKSSGLGVALRRASEIIARYDNAQSTDDQRRQWWGADYLSAKSANSFQVRRQLRNRSRYEVANNPYLFGVCNSNADDFCGSEGPTLQIKTSDNAYNRAVEQSWQEWCAEVELTEKLRTAKVAKTVDGEGFLILKTVEDQEHRVKLYPVDVEADQVTTPAPTDLGQLWVDGLTLHPVTGRPTFYHVLKHHPGDYFFPDFNPLAVEKIPAQYVIHWFGKFRPGQVRGIPVFTSSLDLFTELRAFRRAVLNNAQLAASLTALLESTAPANTDASLDAEGDADAGGNPVRPFANAPITRGMMVTLPSGFKAYGFDPKQPQTTYEMFSVCCLGEAVRPLNYPLNLALGTSQKFNFSSAKLDHINYRNSLTVERGQCNKIVLKRLFRAWYTEAVLSGAIPVGQGPWTLPPHEWHWPGYESIDPLVDVQAASAAMAGGQDTLRDFWGRRGRDWRDVLQQLAIEMKVQQKLGLTFGDVVQRSVTQTQETDDDSETPPNAAVAHRRLWKRYQAAKTELIRAVKDDNGQEHDDKGRFGEGGEGGGGHAEKAKEAHKEADRHKENARKARSEGDHEAAKIHKNAEKASRKVAETHEAIDKSQKEHAEKVAQIHKDHAEKVERAKENLAEHDKKVADARQKVEEAKKRLAESKDRGEKLRREIEERRKKREEAANAP